MAGKWYDFLEKIVHRPNTWGHTPWDMPRVSAKQYASNIRAGFQHGRFPLHHVDGVEVKQGDGHFEAAYDERPPESGQWVVWARWVPAANVPAHNTPAKEVRRALREQQDRGTKKKNPQRSGRR